MPKVSKISNKDMALYKEALQKYKSFYKRLADLEVEGKMLRVRASKIIDKVKMKNILSNIVKQKD